MSRAGAASPGRCTPTEETLEALHDAVRSGKVRYLGASSTHAWQFAKALYLADLNGWTRFVSMQDHYNLIHRKWSGRCFRSAPTRASA